MELDMNNIASLKLTTLLGLICLLSACNGSEKPSETSVHDAHQAAQATLPQIGVQLWSVKDDLRRDFKGTIEAVAAMGFEGVEFFGHEFGEFADNPAGLKEFLQQNNLKAESAHVQFEHLSPDVFDDNVAFYQAIGCDMLIIPFDERAWDPEAVHELIEELNGMAEKLAPYGIAIGYHNHAQEFADFQDATYWDFIAASTADNVVLQLDVGWANNAGKNSVEYVQRYPGRTLTTHYKIRTHEDGQNMSPIIGQNGYDWGALLTANMQYGGTRWVLVEQEEYPNGLTPMEAVAASKKGLESYLEKYRTH
jgi:sugar phosphate isomerase/epimerase